MTTLIFILALLVITFFILRAKKAPKDTTKDGGWIEPKKEPKKPDDKEKGEE
jgi:hypothetical protein